MTDMSQLGERIRSRRHSLSMTLKDIAQATGLSIGLLSQVERNLTVPSLSTLATLAKALGVTIGELAGQLSKPDQPVTYHDRRVPYSLDHGVVMYERLSSVFPGSRLHSVKFIMPQGYRSETVCHEGEEMIYVLRGRIKYRVADREYVLETDDSLHFDSMIPHSIEALESDAGRAEVLWSGSLNIFGDMTDSVRFGEANTLQDSEFNEQQKKE